MLKSIIKFKFKTPVHFGDDSLDLSDTKIVFRSDTLFSALCVENIDKISLLKNKVANGILGFSDALPFIKQSDKNCINYLIPKPFLTMDNEAIGDKDKNSLRKKKMKKLDFIKTSSIFSFINSNLSEEELDENLSMQNELGKKSTRINIKIPRQYSLNVDEEINTEPFVYSNFLFNENAGLYCILNYENKEDLDLFLNCLYNVGLVGIGGRKTAGLGKFTIELVEQNEIDKNDDLKILLNNDKSNFYLLLSTAYPKQEELHILSEDNNYGLIRRGGFVYSETYADTLMKKRNIFAFKSGSCFKEKFKGDMLDVSNGKHPVYKNLKAFLIGVNYE